jgi:benzoyl-CoA reductase/2-hydroxyglutaryl-CoA dehydratase subunit BcrC/BadD/HgdB
LDDPRYIELIEDCGALVAMDDLDTGSRYFTGTVEQSGDSIHALAKRYLTRPGCPRMLNWDRQLQQMTDWVKVYDIDGVIELCSMYSRPREMRTAIVREKLEEAGIPSISLRHDYYLSNTGQIKTRIGAFLETMQSGATTPG